MSVIGVNTPLRELAFLVGTALIECGVEAVLSGGGAATVYAPEANQSRDLDFVLGLWSEGEHSDACVLKLGFVKEGNFYKHPDCPLTLEFIRGPLMIGDEVIEKWVTLKENGRTLNIISATDSVRDRISWFLFYNRVDYSALEAALGVALNNPIDIAAIEDWAKAHGASERFKVFKMRYELGNRT